MGLRIQNNIEAFNTHRQLLASSSAASKSMEKLSSGYRINRAADDAAGLAISEKMRGQIGGLDQAQRNAQDGVSLVQTAEGALNEVHSMLQRVRDLSVQFQNGTLSSDDQDAISAEVYQIGKEIGDITTGTKFNGNALLNGTSFKFQVGANDSETISTTAVDLTGAIGTAGTGGLSDLTGLSSARGQDRSVVRRRPGRAVDHRRRDQERLHGSRQPGRRAEPPRAPSEQPGHVPGEPDGVRVAYPRRGHGV